MKLRYIFKATLVSFLFSGMLIIFFGKQINVTQKPTKADLIVCLGGGYVKRLNKGIELYKNGFSNKLMFTGSGIGLLDNDDEIGFWKIPFLKEKGVHKDDIVFLEHMQNTYRELKEIKIYMLKHNYTSVLIVSDPPHSKRIQYLIDLFKYKKNDLKTKIIGSDVIWWDDSQYVNSYRVYWEVIKEIIAIGYYYLRYSIMR